MKDGLCKACGHTPCAHRLGVCDACGDIVGQMCSTFVPARGDSSPDMVNHPSHYTSHPSGVECIDIIEVYPANIAAAMKYLWRFNLKDQPIQDLEKAAWYINREIERMKRAT